MNVKHFIVILSLIFTSSSCNEESEPCNLESVQTTVVTNIEMNKVHEVCRDIDILWDLSFGVDLEFLIDVECDINCTKGIVFYDKRQIHKRNNGIPEIVSNSLSTAYYVCNKMISPSVTFNTRLGDSTEYYIGDTLMFEYINPRFCLSDNEIDCFSEIKNLNIQEYVFEYIVVENDFICE